MKCVRFVVNVFCRGGIYGFDGDFGFGFGVAGFVTGFANIVGNFVVVGFEIVVGISVLVIVVVVGCDGDFLAYVEHLLREDGHMVVVVICPLMNLRIWCQAPLYGVNLMPYLQFVIV